MKIEYCIGCLRTHDQIVVEGCGSQNCPPSEIGTKTSLKKLITERNTEKRVMQEAVNRHIDALRETRQAIKREIFRDWMHKMSNQITREHKAPTDIQIDELLEALEAE